MENSIELIKSRLNKATNGNWEWEENLSYDSTLPILKSGDVEILNFGDDTEYYPIEGKPPNKNDAEFIANAKSDIQFLIDLIERLESQSEQTQ